jgi:hypothetical protein
MNTYLDYLSLIKESGEEITVADVASIYDDLEASDVNASKLRMSLWYGAKAYKIPGTDDILVRVAHNLPSDNLVCALGDALKASPDTQMFVGHSSTIVVVPVRKEAVPIA